VSTREPSADSTQQRDSTSTPTYQAAVFRDQSTQLDVQAGGLNDYWDYGYTIATCAYDETIAGISDIPGDTARTALCATVPSTTFSYGVTAVLNVTNGDQRRAQRLGDWAPGYTKLECASGEYVRGVSEDSVNTGNDHHFHAIECATGSVLSDTCNTLVFDQGDNRGNTASGDWDVGAYKGECASGEYVGGVSVSPTTGAPHSILCCAVGTPPPTALALQPVISDLNVYPGDTATIDVTATDTATDAVTFSASGPAGSILTPPDVVWQGSPATAVFTWVPQATGDFPVAFTVSDGTNSLSPTATIHVGTTLAYPPALPSGTLALNAQITASGPIATEQCPGTTCQPTVINPSTPSAVQCSLQGVNPGVLNVSCSVALAAIFAESCPPGSTDNCTYSVGQGPMGAVMTTRVPYSGAFTFAWGTGSSLSSGILTGFVGSQGGDPLSVYVTLSAENGATTVNASGQAPLTQ
jgi:hypothetical protein